MMSVTTPCKPILRQVEEFPWLPAGPEPSWPWGRPILPGDSNAPRMLHPVLLGSFHHLMDHPVQMSLPSPKCDWKSSPPPLLPTAWLWQPSQSLPPITADK